MDIRHHLRAGIVFGIIASGVLGPAGAALAQETSPAATPLDAAPAAPEAPPPTEPGPGSVQSDRILLHRLSRELKRVDRETAKVMRQAMDEARAADGSAERETKARLLSLRDQRDRIVSRLLILSMRHGWSIPGIDAPDDDAPAERSIIEAGVFGSIDVLVRRRFAAEAHRIAGLVRMPVVSLGPGAG